MVKPIRVKDVMTQDERQTFEELNYAVLTSATKMERNYYNQEIAELIQNVKTRYFNSKVVDWMYCKTRVSKFNLGGSLTNWTVDL